MPVQALGHGPEAEPPVPVRAQAHPPPPMRASAWALCRKKASRGSRAIPRFQAGSKKALKGTRPKTPSRPARARKSPSERCLSEGTRARQLAWVAHTGPS